MAKKVMKPTRPEILENAPLHYAPENELGVVFLFAHKASKWRIKVDSIRSRFPDCLAYQKTHGREKQIRIEFEYKAKSFQSHGHDVRKCDCLVCWENNWSNAPRSLKIIELRKEFGLGFNVWIQPLNGYYRRILDKTRTTDQWSLPSQCHEGDLILCYYTFPDRYIGHIYRVVQRPKKKRAGWKEGSDFMGLMRKVCRLKAPIFFEDLQKDRILKTASFVRGRMQGRPNATEYWPYLYDLIIKRNPATRKVLMPYSPMNIG